MTTEMRCEREKWRKFRARRRIKVISVVLGFLGAIMLFIILPAAGKHEEGIPAEVIQSNIDLLHSTPEPTATPTPPPQLVTEEEIVMVAKTIWGEARGIYSQMEQAAVAWCIFNRADAREMTVKDVVTEPYQFNYSSDYPTVDDYGRDLVNLVRDVAGRWSREHIGEENVGRVLPAEYMFFGGDGKRNWFRTSYEQLDSVKWTWLLPNPYES